jgi:hypothetical protein
MAKSRKEMTPQELGSAFQQDVEKLLRAMEPANRMRWFRFYDTKSAGSYLPSQPGDHLVLWQGRTFLIEEKLSTVHRSLASTGALRDLMGNEQAAHQILWERSGAKGLVIFKDHANSFVELWPGAYVGRVRNTPRERLDDARCKRFHVEHFFQNLLETFKGASHDPDLL